MYSCKIRVNEGLSKWSSDLSSPGNSAEIVVVVTVNVKSSEEAAYNVYLHTRAVQDAQGRYSQ